MVVLVWGALGLAACGSSEGENGSNTPPPANGGSANGGSANGGNASSGSGAGARGGSTTTGKAGAASTAGTPGSAGAAGTIGAAGASGSAPLRDACRAYVVAYCEKQIECTGTPNSTSRCLEAADRCPDLLMSPGTGHSLQNLLDCVEPIRTANCVDWRREIPPACVTPGVRVKGEPCVYPSQCESTSCRQGDVDSACGVCRGLAAPGGACNEYDMACPRGQHCVEEVCTDIPSTGDPPPPIVINRQAEGEDCFSETCLPELYCYFAADATDGVCRKLPAAGSACAERVNGPRCVSTAYCGPQGCAALPIAGEPCATTDPFAPTCAEDLTCTADGCVPLGALGERCQPNLREPEQVTCQSDLVCACLDDACRVGACKTLAKEGAECGANTVCEHGTVCEAAVCRPTDALTTQAICQFRE
jgi:hypothetical protein